MSTAASMGPASAAVMEKKGFSKYVSRVKGALKHGGSPKRPMQATTGNTICPMTSSRNEYATAMLPFYNDSMLIIHHNNSSRTLASSSSTPLSGAAAFSPRESIPPQYLQQHRLSASAGMPHLKIVSRAAIEEERLQRIAEKWGIEIDPQEWAFGKQIVERVDKPVRMRLHRSCHRCQARFGSSKTCPGYEHVRCTKCPRYPSLPSAHQVGGHPAAEKVKAKEGLNVKRLVTTTATTTAVIRPSAALPPAPAPTPMSGVIVVTSGAGNLVVDDRPSPERSESEEPEVLKLKYRNMLKRPSRSGGQDLVRKKPMQRVKRNCHLCMTVFMPGNRVCQQCSHVRCTDCPRDPAKRHKYPDGYPGDAPKEASGAAAATAAFCNSPASSIATIATTDTASTTPHHRYEHQQYQQNQQQQQQQQQQHQQARQLLPQQASPSAAPLPQPGSMIPGPNRVYKRPVHLLRYTCHACRAEFPPRSREARCAGCGHERCPECPKSAVPPPPPPPSSSSRKSTATPRGGEEETTTTKKEEEDAGVEKEREEQRQRQQQQQQQQQKERRRAQQQRERAAVTSVRRRLAAMGVDGGEMKGVEGAGAGAGAGAGKGRSRSGCEEGAGLQLDLDADSD